MKIAITGIEGFIGRNLKEALRARGHEVVGIDWEFSNDSANDDSIAWGDLTKEGQAGRWLETETEWGTVDLCVHLAAEVGRLHCEHVLPRTIVENEQMTAQVAQACNRFGVRLCYVSTSEIYGDNGTTVCDEYDGPFTLPVNAYGLSKFHGEAWAQMYAPDDLLIVRPTMPYGTGVTPGFSKAAIYNVLHQALTGQRIPIHEGSERSWVWIDDFIEGFCLVLEKGVGIYNVGNDADPRPMIEIARMACEMTGAPESLIEVRPLPLYTSAVKRLSTQRLRRLGWKAEVDIEEGMRRVLEWVRNFDADCRPISANGHNVHCLGTRKVGA